MSFRGLNETVPIEPFTVTKWRVLMERVDGRLYGQFMHVSELDSVEDMMRKLGGIYHYETTAGCLVAQTGHRDCNTHFGRRPNI